MMLGVSNRILTIAENKGKIWILSLFPNLIPTYSTDGEIVFSDLKPKSH